MAIAIENGKRDFTHFKTLWDFTLLFNYDQKLENLKNLALPEEWTSTSKSVAAPVKLAILNNYITHTFGRLLDECSDAKTMDEQQKIIYIRDDPDPAKCRACFNTGLFTGTYTSIYALMTLNINVLPERPVPYYLYNFYEEADNNLRSIPRLPRRANFFTDPSVLVYDHSLTHAHRLPSHI